MFLFAKHSSLGGDQALERSAKKGASEPTSRKTIRDCFFEDS